MQKTHKFKIIKIFDDKDVGYSPIDNLSEFKVDKEALNPIIRQCSVKLIENGAIQGETVIIKKS